jgi:hypothetical protein
VPDNPLNRLVIPTEPAAAGERRDLLSSHGKQVPRLREAAHCATGLTPLGMTKVKCAEVGTIKYLP